MEPVLGNKWTKETKNASNLKIALINLKTIGSKKRKPLDMSQSH